ncbi:hypothetical protein N9R65_02350 [Opitutales bacterium]|nr:hypothetical protein [Opitutales bacterium]
MARWQQQREAALVSCTDRVNISVPASSAPTVTAAACKQARLMEMSAVSARSKSGTMKNKVPSAKTHTKAMIRPGVIAKVVIFSTPNITAVA